MKEKTSQKWPMYSKNWSCYKSQHKRPRHYKHDSIESSIHKSQQGGGNTSQKYPLTVKEIADAYMHMLHLKHFYKCNAKKCNKDGS